VEALDDDTHVAWPYDDDVAVAKQSSIHGLLLIKHGAATCPWTAGCSACRAQTRGSDGRATRG
jgi:hypothetical protein